MSELEGWWKEGRKEEGYDVEGCGGCEGVRDWRDWRCDGCEI